MGLFGVFRHWCNVTELEDCRDVASSDYGTEEVSEVVACQGARVNDVLRVNSIWARGLTRFKALNSFHDIIHCDGYFIPCCSIRRSRYSLLMDCWKSELNVLWGEGTLSCSNQNALAIECMFRTKKGEV